MKNKKSDLIKSAQEIALIREACQISSRLHLLAMTKQVEHQTELDVDRELKALAKACGVSHWAYPTIIGGGERSTILHAKPTNRKLQASELVLIDMGVQHLGYASDITRTWPVGDRFTDDQKLIYKIVLRAQKEVIKAALPGKSLNDLHEISRNFLLDGLLSHGVVKKGNLKEVFPHKTSHWLGRQVHDDCPYFYKNDEAITLAKGMVFTVEPGLYFSSAKSKFRGIGIRIEDVIAMTDSGNEVLSNVPKEVDEIEHIRGLYYRLKSSAQMSAFT